MTASAESGDLGGASPVGPVHEAGPDGGAGAAHATGSDGGPVVTDAAGRGQRAAGAASSGPGHMPLEEFRRHGHAVVDWIADYLARVEERPVLPPVKPGDVLRGLAAGAPERGEPFERILRDFEQVILPGVTHWQHPAFFAYFPANSSPPSVLAEMLTAGLAVNAMLWTTSPAATELEMRVLEWLRAALGLPEGWSGVIQDTASSASLCALLCARERATGDAANEAGLAAQPAERPLMVYVSEQGHSSIEKGAKIAGFGRANVRQVATDDGFAMDPAALERAIGEDVAAGWRPAAICATVGTTSSTALDPVRPIGEIAQRCGAWLHVDAALAGSAALLPEFGHLLDGVELADSFCFNPHKWMLTNFDCCAMYCRDAERLIRTFSITPEYLRTEAKDVVDYRDWGIPLGRRFRALKLWFVMRSYGLEGIRAHLREHIRLAQMFAGWVEGRAEFEVLAPHALNTVCFRWRGGRGGEAQAGNGAQSGDGQSAPISAASETDERLDEFNQRLLGALNASGELFLTHTRLRGRYALRLSVGGTWTTERHVREAWDTIQTMAGRLQR